VRLLLPWLCAACCADALTDLLLLTHGCSHPCRPSRAPRLVVALPRAAGRLLTGCFMERCLQAG
jgi:hypothetical protein